jgi:putative endonuclease
MYFRQTHENTTFAAQSETQLLNKDRTITQLLNEMTATNEARSTAAPRNRRQQGAQAEDIAARFLELSGFRVRERNVHAGRTGELDIVAEYDTDEGQMLVFVEVKARTSTRFGTPEEAITPAKQRTMRRAAEIYLYERELTSVLCRFDVVAIEWSAGSSEPEIRHITNAF